MRWIVDAQLPPALARLISKDGHEAEHVVAHGLRDSGDNDIWKLALKTDAVIVTKDEDFAHWANVREACPKIVWVRIRNCSRRALLDWFTPLLPRIVEKIEDGETLIELRR